MICIDCQQRPAHARQRCATCYWRYQHSAAFVPVYGPRYPHCTIDGCDRSHWARGLCKLHYRRGQRIIERGRKAQAIIERTIR